MVKVTAEWAEASFSVITNIGDNLAFFVFTFYLIVLMINTVSIYKFDIF